ncbi:hypothetical protein PHISCL_04024 [Aspergillus sclerotialis]|uniref:Nuclear control of ATPase protein n=1 Tax=Aspergillus sclerotialis TaxID=2070753 RepID=A0A3A2ZKD3_9EURO|nr:hypothetical protein PHISCL_04024 [Aspergillus sclerotialis]
MSLIDGHVYHLDSQLDNLWQHVPDKLYREDASLGSIGDIHGTIDSLQQLEDIARSLSATSKSQPLLSPEKLLSLLRQLPPSQSETQIAISEPHSKYASSLGWLVAAKATVQISGLIMRFYLDQSLVLGDDLSYWDDIQGSFWRTGVYTVQTFPLRLLCSIQKPRLCRGSDYQSRFSPSLLSAQWAEFYNRLQRAVQQASTRSLCKGTSSLLSKSKSEAQQKQNLLNALRVKYISSIGFLMEECLSFRTDDGIPSRDADSVTCEQLRIVVSKSVAMMEKVLRATRNSTPDFEKETLSTIEREADMESQANGNYSPQLNFVVNQLLYIIEDLLPSNKTFSKMSIKTHGRPSFFTRYWLPFALGICAANTFMKIWVTQRTQLVTWVMDIGSTTVRFWTNWVVEPIEKLVKTIRHDEGSEIALMSKNSLATDRASLERMVVDFVIDHSSSEADTTVANTDAITAKVREGDLTPVLRAYERDLRAPFVGTVRGDLIRALLIQIQKTKVDVEVAMSGIDSLLKSQELVFGFVGLTPGILVSYAVSRWVWGLVINKKGLRLGKKQDRLKWTLRYEDDHNRKIQMAFIGLETHLYVGTPTEH